MDHTTHDKPPERSFWIVSLPTKANLVFAGFLAIGLFFLILEHRAHVLGFLPFLLLLACPLMHVFMHGGHGGHEGHEAHRAKPDSGGSNSGER
jgi:hypothetical protein